jgi:hypothetical protein
VPLKTIEECGEEFSDDLDDDYASGEADHLTKVISTVSFFILFSSSPSACRMMSGASRNRDCWTKWGPFSFATLALLGVGSLWFLGVQIFR